MNSRWQANKIGLINFWYYDEQEFSFVKGRMLLRGSNGSGKSVTMQIPKERTAYVFTDHTPTGMLANE